MFTHNSSVGKTRVRVSLVLVLGLLVGALSLLGCGDTGSDIGEFSGTWTSTAGDRIVIDKSAKTFVYSFGATPSYDAESMDYAGAIVGGANALTNVTGYLTLRITNAGGYGPTVGNYIRIFWKELTLTTVQEAGPYKAGGQNNGVSTGAAAETEYTVGNGYFDLTGAYTKQ
ncbi:hypothetical protein AGMMS49942_24820 [Spirochaetia bacterium]|nr:hypothetical protein AGMMS49942_24820 [Spirochaetia bacterium]